jgi:hypothetical protein
VTNLQELSFQADPPSSRNTKSEPAGLEFRPLQKTLEEEMTTSSGDDKHVWGTRKRKVGMAANAASLLPLGDVSNWWSTTDERSGGERLSLSFPLRNWYVT